MYYRFPIRKVTPVVCGFRAYMKPRYKWLEKLMRVLRLLVDDYDPIMMDRYETVDIAEGDVLRVIRKAMTEMMRRGCDRPKRIYIGEEYFSHLMSHDATLQIGDPIKWPQKIYGMDVVLTPYLETFLPVWESD